MKKYFIKSTLVLIILLIFSNIQAQTFPYFLEVETGTYTDIEESTELTSIGDLWDDPGYNIPIGFDFDFYGETYSNIQFIGLGSWLAFQDPYTNDSINFLIPYFDDLADIELILKIVLPEVFVRFKLPDRSDLIDTLRFESKYNTVPVDKFTEVLADKFISLILFTSSELLFPLP